MNTTTKITVTETLENLARYDSNGLRLYGTPGAHAPYWSNNASFMYDEVIATVDDFAQAAGHDNGFGFEDSDMQEYLEVNGSEKYSLEVEMPTAR